MSAVQRTPNEPGEKNKLSFKVVPYISIESWKKQKNLKKKVLYELESTANNKGDIEIVPLVRKYVSSTGRIHNNLRTLCKLDLDAAEKSFINYRAAAPERSEGLAAIKYTDEGEYIDHVSLVDRPLIRMRKLQSKNSNLYNVHRYFVTSECD